MIVAQTKFFYLFFIGFLLALDSQCGFRFEKFPPEESSFSFFARRAKAYKEARRI
jgi:hypothetical protein